MSQLREVEDLLSKALEEYESRLYGDAHCDVYTDRTESERLMFIHDWAERLRAACSSTETLIRPPPLNGGGLFVRED